MPPTTQTQLKSNPGNITLGLLELQRFDVRQEGCALQREREGDKYDIRKRKRTDQMTTGGPE